MKFLIGLLFITNFVFAGDVSRPQAPSHTAIVNSSGSRADFNTGLTSSSTLRTTSNIYGFDGMDLRQLLTDVDGRLRIDPDWSILLTTTANIGADATYTSAWLDIQQCLALGTFEFSDVASATEGFRIQYSDDASTVRDDSDSFSISAGNGQYQTPTVSLKYARVVYTNGPVATTDFLIQVHCHRGYPKPSSHKVSESINDNTDSEVIKSVSTGRTPNGTYINFPADGTVPGQSTSTTLLANATFTGSAFFSTDGFKAVGVTILSDVISADEGIHIEFAQDSAGTSIVRIDKFTYTSPNIGQYFEVPVQAGFFRLKYVNGATNQTSFKFEAKLNTTQPSSVTSPISAVVNDNIIALMTKAVIVGKQENNIFSNVGLSNTASIKVAITDRPSEVRNRVRIEASIFRTSLTAANTVIYTVTSGKTLYLESFVASAINNANAIGEYRLRNASTDKLGFVVGEKAIGAAAPQSVASPNLPEPIPFTTSVAVNEISGDIQLSFYLIGYEE